MSCVVRYVCPDKTVPSERSALIRHVLRELRELAETEDLDEVSHVAVLSFPFWRGLGFSDVEVLELRRFAIEHRVRTIFRGYAPEPWGTRLGELHDFEGPGMFDCYVCGKSRPHPGYHFLREVSP